MPYACVPGQVVNKYIDQGVAELVPGVLFVDEVRYSPPVRVAMLFLAVVALAPLRACVWKTLRTAARRGPAEFGRCLAQHQVPVTSARAPLARNGRNSRDVPRAKRNSTD